MSELSNGELNVWLAEHLFGFEWWESPTTGSRGLFPPGFLTEWFATHDASDEPFTWNDETYITDYCDNIADAWRVVEALREHGWLAVVKDMPDGYPFMTENDHTRGGEVFRRACAEFLLMKPRYKRMQTFTVADTPARAICEAARKAVEADKRYNKSKNL